MEMTKITTITSRKEGDPSADRAIKIWLEFSVAMV